MTDLYKEGAKFALEQAKDGKMQAIFPLPFFEETRIAGHGTGGAAAGKPRGGENQSVMRRRFRRAALIKRVDGP